MYIECFVVPVPKKKLAAYTAYAKKWAKVWIQHGALAVTESVAVDAKPGKLTSFPQAVKQKPSETVVVSWIHFKSKKARDTAMKKAMQDPLMNEMSPKDWPFDGQRMFWGGFKPLVAVSSVG